MAKEAVAATALASAGSGTGTGTTGGGGADSASARSLMFSARVTERQICVESAGFDPITVCFAKVRRRMFWPLSFLRADVLLLAGLAAFLHHRARMR
jgi:hypothetical protein